jgi:hypothetical protein
MRAGAAACPARPAPPSPKVAALADPRPVEDSPAARRKGWQRMALLVLYFGPSNLLQPQASFEAISERLIVGPVVETLVYSKVCWRGFGAHWARRPCVALTRSPPSLFSGAPPARYLQDPQKRESRQRQRTALRRRSRSPCAPGSPFRPSA